MPINILDKQTANLIAAGEVVERPASAIKEMLENSADAGATRITVEIKNGGTTYFRVTDNGCGMSREDLPKSILRHATSKISDAADLSAIGTYGFRGEALAAIAAVCDLRILTKRREDTFGSVLHICGGEIIEQGDAGCPDGTTFAASDIFRNVPARRKFLKKDFSEANACLAAVEKFALSRPSIAVTFLSDGNIKLKTAGDGILKNTVYSCLGKDFALKLIDLDYKYEGITVTGCIGKPETARSGRSMQNFFVNGRYVRSGTICAALEEGFRAFCLAGKFPAAVIFCDLDFSRVDVNIHPAKTEIKFSEEKKVFEAVLFAVKSALGRGTSFAGRTHEETGALQPQIPAVTNAADILPENANTSSNANEDTNAHLQVTPENARVMSKTPLFENKKDPITDLKNAFGGEREGIEFSDAVNKKTNGKTETLFIHSSLPNDCDCDCDCVCASASASYDTGTDLHAEKKLEIFTPASSSCTNGTDANENAGKDISINKSETEVEGNGGESESANKSKAVTENIGENAVLNNINDAYVKKPFEYQRQSQQQQQLSFALESEREPTGDDKSGTESENLSLQNGFCNQKNKQSFRVIGECFNSFILVEKDNVLYIIDKHAAHERIIYEEIKDTRIRPEFSGGAQTMLEPVRVPLSTEEYSAISENAEYFRETGFEFDFFGTNTVLIRAFPEHIDSRDLPDVFGAIAAKLAEGNGSAAGDIFDRALFSAACKAAVKAGQRNTLFQDEYIAEKIFSSDAVLYCPHGRPVITEFTKEKLYRIFKRT